MRLVIQRVNRASVSVDGVRVAEIGPGALVLAGVARGDTAHDARHLARKTARLRIFNDPEGRLNSPIESVNGSFLVVSQFTLYGDCRKGNRPSYIEAADPAEGRAVFDEYVRQLAATGHPVQCGRFREHMQVELENDGPVTLILESRGRAHD